MIGHLETAHVQGDNVICDLCHQRSGALTEARGQLAVTEAIQQHTYKAVLIGLAIAALIAYFLVIRPMQEQLAAQETDIQLLKMQMNDLRIAR